MSMVDLCDTTKMNMFVKCFLCLPKYRNKQNLNVLLYQLKMMVQMQIPLSNKNGAEQSWKVALAEKLTGRSLGDFGDPEDIAEAAAFLSSDRQVTAGCVLICMLSVNDYRARYMSGACIDVNGGLL